MTEIAKPIAKFTSDLDHISKEVKAVARQVMGADAPTGLNKTAAEGVKQRSCAHAVRKRTKSMTATNSSSSRRQSEEEMLEKPPLYWAIMAYISYVFLVVTGTIAMNEVFPK